ncbi:hypothetical protein [Streptomyces sp. NPDC006638]|uniref:hypothetical protein n=1 Tax=Streptomyces sp. NPDC006638 TaxID=3157183 RepID=UPI0033BEDD59
MKVVEGHFYRDIDEDIWQAVSSGVVQFAARGDGRPDISAFDVAAVDDVEGELGPLVEVRPAGWVAVN